MSQTKCARAVMKISGGAFGGQEGPFGEKPLGYVADELQAAREVCPELAVVVGGGNVIRGAAADVEGLERLHADQCGMLATVINALVLRDRLHRRRVPCSVLSAMPVEGVVGGFTGERCIEALEDGEVVLLAGGTGNPYFTTDTAAVWRAVQVGAELVLKATRVEGVYDADPEEDEDAEFFPHLTYPEVLERGLEVMDLTAVAMAMEHGLPLRVFNYREEGNLARALRGDSVGTLIEGA
jgi:uridylate kinase